MSESTAFPDFIRRIRAGDEQAARELVERYEPVIRCEVRMRLRDPRLYSRFDWTDICQSVMASFFVRAASGQYDLDQPDQLLRLLVVMTRHKLAKQERRHRAEKRDYRRLAARDPAYLDGRTGEPPAPAGWSPAASCSPRSIAGSPRRSGCWPTCGPRAASGRRSPPGWAAPPRRRRKQLARAVDRVEQQLEGSEIGHD